MNAPHEVLGVARDADERTVRSAYHSLIKEHHPDQGGSRERFLTVKRAYERLLEDDSPAGALTAGAAADGGATTATRQTVSARRVHDERGPGLVASGGGLTVRLSAVTDRLPADALLPDHVEAGRRLAASFHVENETGRDVEWRAGRVRFIGTGGDRYLPTVYRPKERDLPAGWRGDDVELASGESVHSLLLSKSVPDEFSIDRVVYDPCGADGPDHQFRFDLLERTRAVLDREPFQ